MRVVVTGAAGFIGSHLCARLVAAGHDVVGIDRVADHQGGDGRAHVRADLRSDRAARSLRGADAVLHLAGRPGVRGRALAPYVADNVEATRALLAACRRAGVGRLVHASSSAVYAPAPGPTAEGAPLAPRSAYGRTKLAAERLCAASGLDVVGLRYFTVYGPGQRADMAFARFIAAALGGPPAPLLGDGRQVRDFTYVDDAVAGTVLALTRGRAGAVYNISGGAPTSLAAAVTELERALERRVALTPAPAHGAEPRRTHADLARAGRELGYRPEVGLAAGLRRQVAAARAPARALAAGG